MAEVCADGITRQFQRFLVLVADQALAGRAACQFHRQQHATGQRQDEQKGEQAFHSGCLVTDDAHRVVARLAAEP